MSRSKTLIYLDDAQLTELRRRSRRSGSSMASMCREAVTQYLAKPIAPALNRFIGCAEGEPGDNASERSDELLKGLLG